jgi:hypothetical protein
MIKVWWATWPFLFFFKAAQSADLEIFGTHIQINKPCEILFTQENGDQSIVTPSFLKNSQCQIYKHTGTNIPKLEFSRGEYVFLLSVTKEEINKPCKSDLASVSISRSGDVRVSSRILRNVACGSAERKEFQILQSSQQAKKIQAN